ncbi:MAG: UDP-N-acetylmuramate dehydrogenase [Anaerovoracaceae bacterium]
MDINKVYDELTLQIDKELMILDAPMKDYTSFKAGGKAALLVQPNTIEELQKVVRVLSQGAVNHMVMGNGTNLLIKDSGYSGVIIKLGKTFGAIEVEGDEIKAGAGVLLSEVAKKALDSSLTGFEFAAGIPGSIGGAAFMNAGAYDGEMSQVILSAQVLSKDGSRVYEIEKDEMDLSYRHSIFQENQDIILNVTIKLHPGEKELIREKMQELQARREEKQPLSYPSAGSSFKRPKGHYAGKLIHDSGLRGLSLGGAQVSSLHAGFIINTGDATASDIINLMEVVRNTVFDKFGVMLEPEVKVIGD